jgi:hypothetical protein
MGLDDQKLNIREVILYIVEVVGINNLDERHKDMIGGLEETIETLCTLEEYESN